MISMRSGFRYISEPSNAVTFIICHHRFTRDAAEAVYFSIPS